MEYPAVLRLPLKTFWSLNRQVDRLRAEEQQRLLRLHSAAGSEDPKAVKQLAETLSNEIGSVVLYEKRFDADKFEQLRKKLARPKRVATETHAE